MKDFPVVEECYDDDHWHNKALRDVWDDDVEEYCERCGFQGHDPCHCPSPRQIRLEVQGKCEKVDANKYLDFSIGKSKDKSNLFQIIFLSFVNLFSATNLFF